MSGVTSSKRQWASLRVRALAATLLALAMLIPAIGVAMAQEPPPAAGQPYPGANKLCITGTVINFDETPLPYGNDGRETEWVITARPTNGGTPLTDTVDSKGRFQFNDLTVGEWEVSIDLQTQPGWEPVPPYDTRFLVYLDYGSKNCVEVRFKLKYPVTVNVYKIDDNHNPLEGWIIRAEPAYGNWFASPIEGETNELGLAVDPDDETLQLFRLTHGKWIFTERAPEGVHFKPVMPESGKQELFVDASKTVDAPIVLRFKNRLYDKGCLIVTKTDAPPATDTLGAFGLPGWKMTLKRLDGSVAATGVTNALGEVRFDKLPFGPYVVVEEQKPGWAPVGPTALQVVVAPLTPEEEAQDLQCQRVLFVNEQSADFCIEGYKLDANGHIGLPNWEITATPVTKGGYPNPDIDATEELTATTDGTGWYRIDGFPENDYRIPGAGYKVCEVEQDGWLPHTSTCFTVYLPKKPGACVKVPDFVNQQVGHSEASWYKPYDKGYGKGGYGCNYTHTVVAGESLFGIGNAYGVSGSAMLAANPWIYSRPNRYVYPGDSVCIP